MEPTCGKCGGIMTPASARLRPELFLHDACLPEELRPAAAAGSRVDCEFVAAVLETPPGGMCNLGDLLIFENSGHPVMVERGRIRERYQELKSSRSFGAASHQARAEWLRDYLKGKVLA